MKGMKIRQGLGVKFEVKSETLAKIIELASGLSNEGFEVDQLME